ncbi:succinic semialdehyde dehydrogenase [Persicimonas caeni]|nr:succinic semialdehyde dehydrogenase [Persicimonas caeni]
MTSASKTTDQKSSAKKSPTNKTSAKKKKNTKKAARTIECYNPATSKIIAEIPATAVEEIPAKVTAAKQAFQSWRRLSVEERCRHMLEARDHLLDHREEILDLLVAETGKAIIDAQAELLTVFETFRYYTSNAAEFLADQPLNLHLLKNKRVKVQYPPIGLVVNISPWNFPIDLSLTPAIPALIAGNAVMIKPSEHTSLAVIRAIEVMNESGLPEGLLQVMPGFGDVGAALCDEADAITFTGSVATGRKVAKAAAENLVPCTLELGGKDPAIVLDDADIERAANGIVWGSFFNSGQVCMSVERVYVHEAVYDQFVERVVELTRDLRQGVPWDYTIDIGAMIDPDQKHIIEKHIKDAVDKGARILTGGKRRDTDEGDFFEPTVLVDVDHSMKIMKEETFGPVMPIMKVRSGFEAVQLANDSEFGLNSSVWTGDVRRGRDLARQIESGQVCINDVIASYLALEAPYGGVKHSGIGRRKSKNELHKFTQSKTVLEDIFNLKKEPFWFPYNAGVGKAVDKVFGVLYRRGISKKITDLFS